MTTNQAPPPSCPQDKIKPTTTTNPNQSITKHTIQGGGGGRFLALAKEILYKKDRREGRAATTVGGSSPHVATINGGLSLALFMDLS